LGITVVFSRHQTSADTVIEGLARAARMRGDHADVVTSDAETQWTVLGERVARRSAAEFSAELRMEEAAWREQIPSGTATSRLEDRIDPSVREVLERWARGQE
jgi:predicted RNA-binding protein with PIN domain